jgi:hypothetical protein
MLLLCEVLANVSFNMVGVLLHGCPEQNLVESTGCLGYNYHSKDTIGETGGKERQDSQCSISAEPVSDILIRDFFVRASPQLKPDF